MKLKDSPRKFELLNGKVVMSDIGKIYLEADELVSFVTPSGRECDFAAKDWGFYPLSSPNSRTKKQGFKVALVADEQGKVQINVVENDKLYLYEKYLKIHMNGSEIICWLDEFDHKTIKMLKKFFAEGK